MANQQYERSWTSSKSCRQRCKSPKCNKTKSIGPKRWEIMHNFNRIEYCLTINKITVPSRLGIKVMDGTRKMFTSLRDVKCQNSGTCLWMECTFPYILSTPILFNIRKKITHAFDYFYVLYKCFYECISFDKMHLFYWQSSLWWLAEFSLYCMLFFVVVGFLLGITVRSDRGLGRRSTAVRRGRNKNLENML